VGFSSGDPNDKKIELFHSPPLGDCLAYVNALKHSIEGDFLNQVRIEAGVIRGEETVSAGVHIPPTLFKQRSQALK
jgi:hypothetical protein